MRLDLSARLAQRYGSRIALTDATRGGGISFEELDRRGASAAERLRKLGVRPGERVSVRPEASKTWPSFALVANEKGSAGWVPKRCLQPEGDQAVVTQFYDTSCLDPRTGELLELIQADQHGGWLRCRDSQGRTGWFPVTMVEPWAESTSSESGSQ